ncbi:unnamed protein product, partial [Meganyctiphanes norvegica]
EKESELNNSPTTKSTSWLNFGSYLRISHLRSKKKFPADLGKLNKKLLHAIEKKNETKVSAALADGANPDVTDKNGSPALINAVMYSEILVKLLLDGGADVNAMNKHNGFSALVKAASYTETLVKLLLDHGADVNAKTNEG